MEANKLNRLTCSWLACFHDSQHLRDPNSDSLPGHVHLSSPLLWLSYPSSSPTPVPPLLLSEASSPPSLLLPPPSSASKIDSLRSKVDLLKLPLALSTKSIAERKSQLGGVGDQRGGGGARKARSPPTRDMDNESQYSGYSYKSSHSRTSRKHRWVCGLFLSVLLLLLL